MMVEVLRFYLFSIGLSVMECFLKKCDSASFIRVGYVDSDIDSQYGPFIDRLDSISFLDCIRHLERLDYRWLLYNSRTWACSVSKCRDLPVTVTETITDYTLYVSQVFAPSSCTDIKLHEGTTEDGEYWLTPGAAQMLGCPTKVYCHNMDSASPSEFITLPNPNEGDFPNKHDIWCSGEVPYLVYGGVGKEGNYIFNKIGIDIQAMSVKRTDYTFVNVIHGKIYPYGNAEDCYASSSVSCGPVGTFQVNTLGTGLKLSPQLTWTGFGYRPKSPSVLRSEGGAKIDLLCGGECGGCEPSELVTLHLNTGDVIIP